MSTVDDKWVQGQCQGDWASGTKKRECWPFIYIYILLRLLFGFGPKLDLLRLASSV